MAQGFETSSSFFKCDWTDSDQNPRGQPPRDIVQQLVISLALGLSSFTLFCVLRPRWPTLYSARKNQIPNAARLPDLPSSYFGWVRILWKITSNEVLASAGLDAYVFLSFFKMAIKFLSAANVLAAAVLTPVHLHYGQSLSLNFTTMSVTATKDKNVKLYHPYLWVYVVFVYLFTALALYLLLEHTQDVTRVRQEYLGNQASVTDCTVKFSGIPKELRSEQALKEYIESLEIGKVESVTVCRKWRELDKLMQERGNTLRKLEEVYTVHQGTSKVHRNLESLPAVQPEPPHPIPLTPDQEAQPLLPGEGRRPYNAGRPKMTLWRGWFDLRKVDAIDYLTMKLGSLDEQIKKARQKEFEATPIAFITMDSVSSAQIVMQTLLDPNPGAIIARQAPAPPDVVWPNTYLSRSSRMFRQWSVSIFVTFLSIIWLIPVGTLGGLLKLQVIRCAWPGLADVLESHKIVSSLVQNFLPTLILTLLNAAVPYLYDWLSYYQGLISLSDVELSTISKNFFFSFFNLFLAFTLSATAFSFGTLWEQFKDSFKDTTAIAFLLAQSLEGLWNFYTSLIMLQGLGMFPLRLLNAGNMALYPVNKYGAKTPRDYAELVQPPLFKYSFYLPQPILVFIICVVYSILPFGILILVFGWVYFVLGYFTYKYQLLYAMDHPRHSTGKAWPMIVYRIILGLIVFQLAMAGVLALRQAFVQASLVIPLLLFTVGTIWHYNQYYLPSNHFVALHSAKGIHGDPARDIGLDTTVDEDREEGTKYINPSLVTPLENAWVMRRLNGDYDDDRNVVP